MSYNELLRKLLAVGEWIRVGSYKQKLQEHPSIERELWAKTSGQNFEDQKAKTGLSDQQILEHIDYRQYFKMTQQPVPSSQEKIIAKLEQEAFVITDNGGGKAITNLGAILFATNLNDFTNLARKMLRIIVYESSKTSAAKEYEEVRGYASGFTNIIDHIEQAISTEQIKALRSQSYMIPMVAVRELVTNMMMHQDFGLRGTGPMVEIFPSRMVVTNPGKALVETDQLVNHNPVSRNEKLARFMRRLGMCEERGMGVDKIIEALEEEALPSPRFLNHEQYFRATLYAFKPLKEWSSSERVQAAYFHSCLRYEQEQPMTNASLRQRFRVEKSNYPMVSRIIKDAMKAKLIKLKDPDNNAPRYASYIPGWA